MNTRVFVETDDSVRYSFLQGGQIDGEAKDESKAKAFGLALVTTLLMGIVASPAARAAGKFTAEGSGKAVSGTQLSENVFTTTHGTVKCSTTTFAATTTGMEAVEQKLTPTFAGCKFAGIKAEVTPKSCFYRLTAEEAVGEGPGKITAFAHLECSTAGDSIVIEIPGSKCALTIPPQTIENGIVLESSGTAENMEVIAKLSITGLDYNADEPTLCPNPSDVTSHTERKTHEPRGRSDTLGRGGIDSALTSIHRWFSRGAIGRLE